jgi:hypothetical protein
MDDYLDTPDVPAHIALIAIVSLWGALTCGAALACATFAYAM